jgi:glycosyltransferase involved in cell wall biosynthesis
VIAYFQGAPAFAAIEGYLRTIASAAAEREDVVLIHPEAPELAPFGDLRRVAYPVELNGSVPRLVAWLVPRLRRLRPRLLHVNDPWPAALVAARLARVPRVLVTHHTPALPRHDNLAGTFWRRLGWATRPEVIYTSASDRRADGRALSTHVVYYGIDLERFTSARPALAKDGRVVGNVGDRLLPQKGQRYLIDAAPAVLERHPDVRFVVVGGGEPQAELEAHARATGVGERFLFTGRRDDVPALLASFDVFALPSLFEGLCYAVIEAQAAGVPVVATPVGGVPENVVEGETGVIVRAADPGSLAAGINRLLDDPAEAARLAAEARRRVLARYSVERMVEETLSLYSK